MPTNRIDPPPTVVELVTNTYDGSKVINKATADSIWKKWINNLFVFLQVENWHEIGATDEPAFQNGFVNVGGTEETAGFYLDPFGVVHIKGRVNTGTVDTVIFALPTGYRPPKRIQLPGLYAGPLFMQVNIETNGDVLTFGAGGIGNTNIQGISFRI